MALRQTMSAMLAKNHDQGFSYAHLISGRRMQLWAMAAASRLIRKTEYCGQFSLQIVFCIYFGH